MALTPLKFANAIRRHTKQTSATLSDADILLLANPIKDRFAEKIAAHDPKGNYFVVPSKDNFIAGQREFALPDKFMQLFNAEIAFSSDTDDFGELPYVAWLPDNGAFRNRQLAWTEANITGYYSNQEPKYDIRRRSLFLLSGKIDATTIGAATVTDGIRLKCREYPADLSAVTDNTTDLSIDPSTTTFGMPIPFHELWALACSIQWKGDHPGAVPFSPEEQNFEASFSAALDFIFKNDLESELNGSIPYYDPANF